MIVVECNDCLRRFQVGEELGGKVAKCICGSLIRVHAPETAPAPQAKPAATPAREATPSIFKPATTRVEYASNPQINQPPVQVVAKGGPGCLVQLAALVIILVFGVPLLIFGGSCAATLGLLGVAATSNPAEEELAVADHCPSCKEQGLSVDEIQKAAKGYEFMKSQGRSKEKIRLDMFQGCNNVDGTSKDMEICHACVDEILAQVFNTQ